MSDLIEILQNTLPAVNDSRQRASLEKAIALGVPTMKNEEWKYTYYHKVLQQGFTPDLAVSVKQPIDPAFIDAYAVSTNRIVFADGVFQPALSFLAQHPEINFWNSSNISENTTSDFLIELNNAFASDGVFLEIGNGVALEELIEIFYIHTDTSKIVQLRNKIKVGKNAQVKIAEYFINLENSPAYINNVSEIEVEENGIFELDKIQDGGHLFNITDTALLAQNSSSSCTVNTISLTGGITRNALKFDINGERAEAHMNGLYLLQHDEHTDNRTLVNHNAPNCESNELYKGVLGGKSTGVFNGKIVVKPDAQKTNAFQSNRNILLSDAANIYTKPQLEIFADDVKCSHGATSSQIEDSELFYLQTRGIGKDVAKGLLVYAFAAEVIGQIKNNALRQWLEKRIAELLMIDL
jgi:Fe-S cluster assembly protein SufD